MDSQQTMPSDTEMIDWIESHSKGDMTCWACIEAFRGRGFTVYRTARPDGKKTVREAIATAMSLSDTKGGS